VRKKVSMIWTFSLLMAFPVRGGETSPNATELPEDPAYHMRLAVRKTGVILDGPTDDAQAEGTDFIKGHDIDAAGNIYWSESNSPVIRSYRANTGRVIALAGSVRGLRDGPLESARFGGWWYNATNLVASLNVLNSSIIKNLSSDVGVHIYESIVHCCPIRQQRHRSIGWTMPPTSRSTIPNAMR